MGESRGIPDDGVGELFLEDRKDSEGFLGALRGFAGQLFCLTLIVHTLYNHKLPLEICLKSAMIVCERM